MTAIEVGYEPTMVLAAESLPTDGAQPGDLVAGYRLEQRLGEGAYGEVWRAVGPGGLHKAVKILHGQHDGPQAMAEWKSLDLMRELRHPFILSIERIEIAEGRLIIVTELADRNLHEMFLDLRRQGQKGIPRDTLLGYLRDVADALDFMHERHGLQHLDIKPGNLLLQGEHVKIADFGLIKSLTQTGGSRIGGFTPLYAPPELFDGRPNVNSDQYSLAIVYQTMLSGIPPFSGRNAAQLMAQHINSPPDLSALSASDRPAVARALSKNPRARFSNCRQFLERLSQGRAVRLSPSAGVAARLPRAACCPSGGDTGGQAASGTPGGQAADGNPIAAVPLAPIHADLAKVRYRPSLFFGIGGLGGRVLSELRRRLGQRFGATSKLPSLPMLYLDTDPKAIAAARSGGHLEDPETLAISLRDPRYYRSKYPAILEWLSRRWLFNIPRSRQVEGIRPLGRLAVSDHHESIRDRVRQMMQAATAEDSLAAMRATTQLDFLAGPLAVYIVASMNGGTGSGGVPELAYLVRSVFMEAELKCDAIIGLLVHTTSARDQQREIQTANAVACIQELRHYGTPGLGYPGDADCRLPGFQDGPFDHTYFVHLGDDLNDADYSEETEKLAEYLFRDTVTPARRFFEACRGCGAGRKAGHTAGVLPRTFGIGMVREDSRQDVLPEADALCLAVVRKWRGSAASLPPSGRVANPDVPNGQSAMPPGLLVDTEQWAARAAAVLRGDFAKQVEAYFRAKWEQLCRRRATPGAAVELPLSDIDQVFIAIAAARTAESPLPALRSIDDELTAAAQATGTAICAKVLALVDRPGRRLIAARETLANVESRLDSAAAALSAFVNQMEKHRDTIRGLASRDEAGQPTFRDLSQQEAAWYREYCKVCLCENVYRRLLGCVDEIRAATKQLAVELNLLGRRLEGIEELLGCVPRDRSIIESAGIEFFRPAGRDESIRPASEPLAQAFEDRLRTNRSTKPSNLLKGDDKLQDRFLTALRGEAARFLADGLGVSGTSDSSPVELSQDGPWKDAVAPRLAPAGAGRRVLAVISGEKSPADWRQELEAALGDCVTLQPDAQRPPFLCCEVEGLNVDAVVDQLTGQAPSLIEMASRLHTRIDISW